MNHQNSNNPGCVDPAGQAFAPPPSPPARRSPVPRSLPATSTGEVQVRSPANTVATEGGSGAVAQSTGEAQFRNILRPEVAATTCRGLPADVHAGSARPGGLATDVVVK